MHLRLCAALTLALAAAAQGGELNPPAPPAATTNLAEPRTPITALPVTIEASGSYYLTGNLTMPGAGNGIAVLANHVTIDLGGFTLAGAAPAVGDAIWSDQFQSFSHITVRNGFIRNWGGAGIELYSIFEHGVVEDVHVSGCSGRGISLNNFAMVLRSSAEDCGSDGIFVNGNSTVEDCISVNNSGDGIRTSNNSVVQGCASTDNSGAGINATGAITNCTSSGNATGILTGTRAIIEGCVVEGNTTGINASSRSTITGCSVRNSGSVGIDIGGASAVRDCEVTVDSVLANADGIVAGAESLIIGNLLRGHVNGSGIVLDANRNRVEGNTMVGGDIGLEINGDNNLVIGNSHSGNTTNLDNNGLSNVIGPTVTSGTINGSSNPHANYSY